MSAASIGARSDRPSLVVVGAAVRDIDPTAPRGWRLGGGACYGALTAARLGLRVRALVGVDGVASSAEEFALLTGAAVEVEPIPLVRGPVMENLERPGGRLQLVRQASDPLPSAALRRALSGAEAVLLAPVAGELTADCVDLLSPTATVGLAWQGLVRRLIAGRPMERLLLRPHPLIARADVAVVSREDAIAGGATLRELLPRDGQELVVTDAGRGGLHLTRRGETLRGRLAPAVAGRLEVAPTGAGDVFLAAWLSTRLCLADVGHADGHWRALAVASAAASLSVEAAGLGCVPNLLAVARAIHQGRKVPPRTS